MTTQDLYRRSTPRHGSTDALRTALLLLATVLVFVVVVASVPDKVWTELTVEQTADMPDWHGNVAAHGTRR